MSQLIKDVNCHLSVTQLTRSELIRRQPGETCIFQQVEGNGKQALKLRMNSALNMSRLLFWPKSTRTFIKWEESERDLWFVFAHLFEAAVILHYMSIKGSENM